ncbi:putative DNA excision/repair protein SNF2 [Trypanosoma cruzi]|uniref:Putative DNA excision/repair protein SNF2 n=1 Tax=Trypanosoma cruzi TaxID=5693 RepID=A0A2V2X339_TRYCR|nr:putative DNA excision/repair protein SNF2 [Trypanosoma cruzi]
MGFDNPFATFLGKRRVPRTGLKRHRIEGDVSLESTQEYKTTAEDVVADAASATASPNAAELSCAEKTSSVDTAFSSPVKVVLLSDDRDLEEEEEEEELRLLLGGHHKVSVRPKEVAAVSSSEGADVAAPTATTPVALRDLPWTTRSNAVLAEIAERFAVQFRWELRHNVELVRVFEPFFSDKAVRRIEAETRGPQFLPAPVATPENTGAASGYMLRSYQLEGVQYLLNNFHRGSSCILADDMGLGKTAQISAFLHLLKTQHTIDGPHLIVSPLSTLTGWTRELARWAPTLRVVKYHGERKGRASIRTTRGNRHCVFVTTPAVLNQDRGFFRKRAWVVAVIDEAHVLKGRDTIISYVARKLTACFRLAVTGTPVHNNLGEVWSLMKFLYPSYCASYDSSGDDDDPIKAAEDCAKLLQYVMLRRTKGSIELGIPPRVDEPTCMIEPTRLQRQLLFRMTEQALNGDKANATRLQAHFTHQRIVCCHPLALRILGVEVRASAQAGWEERLASAGIELDEASIIAPSAKMIELDRMLREFKANGHRCLIFSNFTSILDLLQALCVLRGYGFERIDGSTPRVERELSMIRFNAPGSACFVFLLTTTAGGVGVTLTGADTVILFDAHYNPQIDRQAADRAHRIGQTRVVRVHRLCLKNTIEERIHNVALRKASLGDFIVDGGSCKGDDSSAPALSAHQILLLFGNENRIINYPRCHLSHMDVVDFDHDNSVEETMVEALLCNEVEGLPRSHATTKKIRGVRSAVVGVTHHCFVCGEIMRPLEPLYHCAVCPKAYHADCIGERRPKAGMIGPRRWTCPRHSCVSCGKVQGFDGAVFMCTECPSSFCFDCLDSRYFELDDTRTQFVHIRREYPGMEAEGMNSRRSIYYIACLRCCGLLSSSSSSASSSSSETESDAVNDDAVVPEDQNDMDSMEEELVEG